MNSLADDDIVVSPTYHLTVIFSIGVFVSIVLISYAMKVEIVAQGTGKVVPAGRVQLVQPEFGGRIDEIRVQNGAFVSKGDLLIRLDRTNAQSEVNTLRDEISRLEVEMQRLNTLTRWVKGSESVHPMARDEIVHHFRQSTSLGDEAFLKDQEELLSAELKELFDALLRVDARIEANSKSEAISYANVERVEEALKTQKERFDMVNRLFENGATSRMSYLDSLDALNRLRNEREIYIRELEQKSALKLSYQRDKSSIVSAQRSRVVARQVEITASLREIRERLTTAEKWLSASDLVAPVSGTVDRLLVHTVGGVVASGQQLMRIVPAGENFEIETVFPNSDVGFMEEGQMANIKLDAFPSERFGFVIGEVASISADSLEVAPNTFGFKAKINPETAFLVTKSAKHPLRPGMTATVDIITGERRLISYFFGPIVKAVQESLGER